MKPFATRVFRVLIDLGVLSVSIWLAYALRFELHVPVREFRQLLFIWVYVVLFKYILLDASGVTRSPWRYTSLREVLRIVVAMAAGASGLAFLRIAAEVLERSIGEATILVIPFGVILIDFALSVLGITGARTLRRVLSEQAETRSYLPADAVEMTRTLLVGAGRAGLLVARQVAERPDLGILPVGFVDPDPRRTGTMLHGLPVLGTPERVVQVCERAGVEQVLITLPTASGREIRAITLACEEAGIVTKIIPGLYEIVGGQLNLSRIRPVQIEDLLRREPVVLDEASISAAVRDRVVLVTGGGGSIGAELCRQVTRFRPRKLVIVERNENALFEIHRELREVADGALLVPVLADICDGVRMHRVFDEHRPAVVFHAAAHKHVSVVELNPGEAVHNNVLGTVSVAEAADAAGAETFVLISTDKAVNPASVMGATKRVAELYVQALARRSDTRFVSVRFGNVLGSAGSVVPIFHEQIARGGPVTVTHEDMRRYFMTIPEACQLVIQAAAMGAGGEVFVLDMGEPVRIVDLAHDVIALSGLRPDEDIEVQITGPREGEKLFEELHLDAENAERTRHPKIFIGRVEARPMADIVRHVERLADAAATDDAAAVRAALKAAVPEYRPEQAARVATPPEGADELTFDASDVPLD